MGAYGSPEFLHENDMNLEYDKNLIYCQKCGLKYSKKKRKCPQCGTKHAQPFYNRWWFWVLIVLVIFAFYPQQNHRNDANVQKNIENTDLSEENYKSLCVSLPYDDLARNPNNYVGQYAVFSGKVIQVQESGKNTVLRLDVTKTEQGIWQDTVYVDYKKKSDNESRILENDIITVYGKMNGIKDYITVLGNQISIPHILVEYIETN